MASSIRTRQRWVREDDAENPLFPEKCAFVDADIRCFEHYVRTGEGIRQRFVVIERD